MDWGDANIPADEETAYKVLHVLRPHSNLRKLRISSYNGTRFPSWVGDPSFDKLTELRLESCESCTCLSTLGQLPLLRSLFLVQMKKVMTLDSKLVGPANSCPAFPALEVLELHEMPKLRIWSTNVVNNGIAGSFPLLREVCINMCPILDGLSIGSMPSLDKVYMYLCPELVFRNIVRASSSILTLKIQDIQGLTHHLRQEVIEHLPALEYLRITECKELTCLWESELVTSKILVNLKKLDVRSCESLLSVGGEDVTLGVHMNAVREVTMWDCNGLESYKCLNGIERLLIHECSMTSLTFELPSTLQYLHINSCENLEDTCFQNNLPSLESLYVREMPNLRSFPDEFFEHLVRLEIIGCDEIDSIPESGFGFLPHLCLRYLSIKECKNLKSFPHQHLQRLTSLKEMKVTHCPSMNDSFPCGSWPPNLSSLSIGNLMKPMSEWGSQNFPASLATLNLKGRNSGMVSFAKDDDVMNSNNTTSLCFLVPSSLTSLSIVDFIHLKSLAEGLQHLTGLEELDIQGCPKLRDLPTTLLPSLLALSVYESPELKERCNEKGDYWPIISEIPYFYTD